ncbi:hypothetical protein involved in outer membrane biogenesis [Acidovorax sp. CF316]|uniref:DUF748 domain-containing protein n=1 Tax=Acidovorax sp. CF316 TaxID=1144317 RepID=UPI00026BDAE8|nr:DUF748 domain-containing protein [Acidovorax sp. CF316]EJE53576.1 hypothetical protein involved in outer membrane biogenesis [Acidovorax sp. CF316]
MSFPKRLSLTRPSLAALRQHRWARRAAVALAALLALWLLTWLAVPPLLKGPLQRAASEQLGRAVTVGAIDFQPWSLELTLRDIAVAGADGGTPQLTIARVHVDGELQSLLRLAPVVDEFTVESPVLHIAHLGEGRYDVDDVIAKLTAPPAEPQPDTGPARLALYNLALVGGSIDYDDRSVGKKHSLRDLALKVPFISTLPSQREVKVEPHLAFSLNGSRFDSSAQGTPFAQTGKTDAAVRWEGVDLAPYLAYLPASLPVKVQGATLDVNLKVAFEQAPTMAVKLTGSVQASNVRLADRAGQDLLAYERLKIDLADVRPLDQVVRLSQVELIAPVLSARRDAAGQVNLAQLAPATPPADAVPASAASRPASSASGKAAAARPWTVEVAHTIVRGGTLRWADQSTRPAAALEAREFTLDAKDLALPWAHPVTFEGGLKLQDGSLAFQGEATDQKAQVQASLNALALPLAAPYLAQVLEPTVAGQLTGDIGVQWAAADTPAATGITLTAGPLALEQLALRQGKSQLASLGRLELKGLQLPLDKRTATLESLVVTQPKVTVDRDADGRWMFERWMKTQPAAADESAATAPAAAAPWVLRVADFALQGGTVSLADRAQARPVALELSTLGITAKNLATDGSKPEALQLSAQVATGKGSTPGKLDYQGTLALQPLAMEGKLSATRLPLHALDGYLASQLSVELLRADVGFRGQVAFSQNDKGPSLRLSGDAVVDDLKANSTSASTPKTEAQVGEELLAWKSLNLRGLALATAPGTAPRLEVKETSLADFFARITINEAGRINLGDIAKTPAEAQAANAASAAKSVPPAPVPAASTASAAVAAAPVDPLAPVVQFGPVSLVNGKVLFSDFFIKPNYSADLSELTGKLSAFSTAAPGGEPVLADLELRGKAEGTASLEITGKLNPLAKPLALDIAGKVRDLELPPLSPYAVKYAGHGIERGKLSVDVAYKVLPSGQLTASNRLVLNQLTFGEAVAGAPNSLPVKLAVALLADRQGVIDLDLPLSGSLNDPEFRVGPVIWKIIVNLIGKALTSPFSLLASALGGGDELSSVPFAPGSATLSPEAQQNLAKVVKALTDRPNLRITVTGLASLQAEREGIQREHLQQLVLAEKRRASPADTAPVQAAEYPALLKEVYRRADIPKPRNLVGLARELTTAEMEALLLANQPATEAMAQELATQRGQAVRSYLLAQKLPVERLFLAAPRAGTQPEKWSPQAQMSLATQ